MCKLCAKHCIPGSAKFKLALSLIHPIPMPIPKTKLSSWLKIEPYFILSESKKREIRERCEQDV